jgi:hypothetical protein
VRRRSNPADAKRRQRAKELKAADARATLQSSLPFVLAHMTEAHVQQMQRVLDAAVVNPVVQKEANELYQRSIVAQSGELTMRDPEMVRRSDKAMEAFISVTDADKRIRLDFEALLDPDALKATTDNPDEAEYLGSVRQTLARRGVWLRFEKKLVEDPEDPSRHVYDPRLFEAWLSLGPDGDAIPTETGRLTRKALLGTTAFGAGYYEHVHRGPVQAALDREINRLLSEIDSGWAQHNMVAKIRREAFFGVVEVSDWLGGADFPDQSIWEQPHRLVLQALNLNTGGNVRAAQAFLVAAAIVTRNAGQLLADYIDESSEGAESAVKVLTVVKTAGEVAEIGLAVTGVGAAVRGAAVAGGAAGGSVDAAAERLVTKYVAENPSIAGELSQVRWVPGPRGSVAGGVKPGTSSGAGTGWHRW